MAAWVLVGVGALVIATLLVAAAFERAARAAAPGAPPEPPLEIRVVAHQYWWEVFYPGDAPGAWVATANEVHIPIGRPVTLHLTTHDVLHSLWIPALGRKVQTIPGKLTRLELNAAQPGVFRGHCAEFCGASHAHMAFEVTALPPEAFRAWLQNLQKPAREAETRVLRAGRNAFMAHGCANCHAIRGVAQPRLPGPDLTHFGARRYLGAGVLLNGHEQRVVWLTDGERVKPGRAMPSYPHLSPDTLRALAEYLGSLQ